MYPDKLYHHVSGCNEKYPLDGDEKETYQITRDAYANEKERKCLQNWMRLKLMTSFILEHIKSGNSPVLCICKSRKLSAKGAKRARGIQLYSEREMEWKCMLNNQSAIYARECVMTETGCISNLVPVFFFRLNLLN